eukprot:IDg6320t1
MIQLSQIFKFKSGTASQAPCATQNSLFDWGFLFFSAPFAAIHLHSIFGCPMCPAVAGCDVEHETRCSTEVVVLWVW